MAEPTNSLDALNGVDEILGLGSSYSASEQGIFSSSDEEMLASILKNGTAPEIDTSRAKNTTGGEELPEYFKEHQNSLDKPIALEPDTTNYAERAVKEFGPGYEHITNRDQFHEEIFVRAQESEYIGSNQHYKTAKDLIEGRLDKAEVVKNDIRQVMTRQAEQNYQQFDESAFDENLARFFTDGELNSTGQKVYDRLVNHYKGFVSEVERQASQQAKIDLTDYRNRQSALESEIKDFNILGIGLGDELGAHLKNFIKSGKLDEIENEENVDPKKFARRTLLKALVYDEASLIKYLREHDKRSISYGVNNVARKKFN